MYMINKTPKPFMVVTRHIRVVSPRNNIPTRNTAIHDVTNWSRIVEVVYWK